MTDDQKYMQKSMGLASMQKPAAPAQSPAVAAMPAQAIAKLSRRQAGSSDLMGLGGMRAAAQKAQQRRNRVFSAGLPPPTPFVSNATTRTAVAQGYEVGSPNSGPQVIRDLGNGKYAIGNNPNMQALVDANQLTNLRHYFS